MLKLPEKGVSRSVKNHNVDYAMFCDWLESAALFTEDRITGSDAVDLLRENEVYASQEFAWAMVEDAFSIIKKRRQQIGAGYPLRFTSNRLELNGPWQDFVPYAFCLTLSLSSLYPSWWRSFGTDYTEQGELFEAFTAEAVRSVLKGWEVHPTGWTRTNPSKLSHVVQSVATKLGEATGELLRWSKATAKEAGLDLLCFQPFPDQRNGLPVYLLQCASGGDWSTKLKTPDLRLWTKLITFPSDPKQAFSMPYALDDIEYVRSNNLMNGLLMDRSRLLAAGHVESDWLEDGLKQRLSQWISGRISTLPLVQ